MQTRTAAGAKTLPSRYFCSAEIFELEQRSIFLSSWLFAGHVGQLDQVGDYFLFATGSESAIVLRDRSGEIRAFHNVCRHRGSRLCSESAGRLGGAVQCPYHAWTYELDGRLRTAPTMEEVAAFDSADHSLHPVACRDVDGLVFVNWSDDPEPFERQLPSLASRIGAWRIGALRVVHRTVYEVGANWKLLFQNYSECYHCPTAHPLLNRLTPFRDSINDLESGPVLGGPMTLARGGGGSMTMSGARCAAPLHDVATTDLDKVYYYTVFPNLFVSLHPDYVLLHRAEPLAADRSRIVCEWLFDPAAAAEPGFDPRGAIEFWDTTNRQDWHLCTISQQGISSSAYRPGPYSELESQLAAFDRHYLSVLGEPYPPSEAPREP